MKAIFIFFLLMVSSALYASPYQAPEKNKTLPVGSYLADLPAVYYSGHASVQKLSDRAYWVGVEGYSSIFVVGESSVLVVDAFSTKKAEKVIKAISEVTDKPIKGLFYTHYHLDDLGDAQIYVDHSKKNGIPLSIIASRSTADQISRYGNVIPSPTDIINEPEDVYTFDGVEIWLITPKNNGHTADNTMVYLPKEKVVLYQDTINPDQLPFIGFGVAQSTQNYKENLTMMLSYDWNHFVGGHANIGSKKDVMFTLEYIEDIKKNLSDIIPTVNFSEAAGNSDSEAGMFKNYRNVIISKVKKKMESKYGKYYAYDAVVDSHITKVFYDILLYNS